MVLQLEGAIVRIRDSRRTSIVVGLQIRFILQVMRVAWSPKTEMIRSDETEKGSNGGKDGFVQRDRVVNGQTDSREGCCLSVYASAEVGVCLSDRLRCLPKLMQLPD